MMKSTALTLLVAIAQAKNTTNMTATPSNGVCDVISGDLPSECQCTEGDSGQFAVACTVDFLDVDTIDFTANFQPCAAEAEVDFEIVEEDAGIDYTKSYTAGEAAEYPIPGLTVGIPVIGDANVMIAADVEGNAGALAVKVGLDACITVLGYQKCGSDLTSDLPYYVLSDSYDFSDYCQ
jgi:hypothetical protein